MPYNTFRVSVQTRDFLVLRDIKDLVNEPPMLVLGGGANTLFVHDFPGLVIKNELRGRRVLDQDDETVTIEVASGESWIDLVNWTTEQGWSGLENMALIPGTVGAAAAGNIAAYGGNFEDVFESAIAIELSSSNQTLFSKKDLQFGYRESIFSRELKNKFFLTSAVLKLAKNAGYDTSYHSRYESLQEVLIQKGPPPYSPQEIAQAVTKLRLAKLPDWREVGTAGSFFKNPLVTWQKFQDLAKEVSELQWYPAEKLLYAVPNSPNPPNNPNSLVKIPAGRLLEKLGWKGKRIGNVGTWPKHALTVVNYGGATGLEILDFTQQMHEDIQSHFDIDLEAEVNII